MKSPFYKKFNLPFWCKLNIKVIALLTFFSQNACRQAEEEISIVNEKTQKIQFVPFQQVKVTDDFWGEKLRINREVTVLHNLEKCEEVGVITNFVKAGKLVEGSYEGLLNWDNFLYKAVEAASYTLMQTYSPALDSLLDNLIEKIALAQEDDGYIQTFRTVAYNNGNPNNLPEKWENLKGGLELYTAGHLFEAAVAHKKATGKDNLLRVAIKKADLIAVLFGNKEGQRKDVPGHEEIELASVRLFEVTGDTTYLNLSEFFIDQRGNAEGHTLYGGFHQDHEPFVQQKEAVGQAPRATYLYSGAADVAYYKDRPDYRVALETLWEDVVYKKMYINGGIGSLHENEGFGEPYELPNLTAYTEICAAISFPMWNTRMFKLDPDVRYFDIVERTLYNNFIAGVSQTGNSYFYACPLESDGEYKFNLGWLPKEADVPYKIPSATRKEWFPCACCPPNLARYYPQIPSYAYAFKNNEIFINLFMQSETTIALANNNVKIKQQTNYPWEGNIQITLSPEIENTFTLNIRIPSWVQGNPVPGDLYTYLNSDHGDYSVKVNGESFDAKLNKGYLPLTRKWRKGDVIEIDFPMTINRVLSHPNVKGNAKKVAFERGPILFCFEGIDNEGLASEVAISDEATTTFKFNQDLLEGTYALEVLAKDVNSKSKTFTAIPYFLWSNRGEGKMAVWVNRK